MFLPAKMKAYVFRSESCGLVPYVGIWICQGGWPIARADKQFTVKLLNLATAVLTLLEERRLGAMNVRPKLLRMEPCVMVDGNRSERRSSAISLDFAENEQPIGKISGLNSVIGACDLHIDAAFGCPRRFHNKAQRIRIAGRQRKQHTADWFPSSPRTKLQKYSAAQRRLESLVKSAPDSFEVNELLGLVARRSGQEATGQSLSGEGRSVEVKCSGDPHRALPRIFSFSIAQMKLKVQFQKVVQMEPQGY